MATDEDRKGNDALNTVIHKFDVDTALYTYDMDE
jgi:hypothetical protein